MRQIPAPACSVGGQSSCLNKRLYGVGSAVYVIRNSGTSAYSIEPSLQARERSSEKGRGSVYCDHDYLLLSNWALKLNPLLVNPSAIPPCVKWIWSHEVSVLRSSLWQLCNVTDILRGTLACHNTLDPLYMCQDLKLSKLALFTFELTIEVA